MKVRFHFVKREKDTFFNHLTKWATESEMTHTFVSWVDKSTNMILTYQVNKDGAYLEEYNTFMDAHSRKNLKVIEFDLSSSEVGRFVERVYDVCFRKNPCYDIKGAIGLGLFRKFGLKVHKLFDGDASFSCAEAAMDAYEFAKDKDVGIEGLFGPQSFYELLKTEPNAKDVTNMFVRE